MRRMLLALTAVLLAGICRADWPQFQGSNRDGVSNETVKLADAWPEGGPPVLWKNERLGKGYGGAVVRAGKVYLLDRVNDQKDVLRCLDLATGKEEWAYAYDCPGKYKMGYNGSRNLPALDDRYIFTLGPYGHLHCISQETHEVVWSKNIVDEYGATVTNWGLCQSPVLYKDTVIVAPMSDKAGAVALDKATGKEVWKSAKLGKDVLYGWTSPLVATFDGVDTVIVLSCRSDPNLAGIDVATGKVLWNYRGWKCPNPIASPIAIPDGRIFVTGGYDSGGAMVKVSKAGDEWKVQEVFNNKNLSSQAQNPIYYKGFIYANSSGNKSGLMCLGLDGEVKWKTSNEDEEEIGGLLVADGKILSLLSQKGILRLVAATPDGYKELAQAPVATGREIWGVMALSEGKLLLRNQRTIICLDLRAKP